MRIRMLARRARLWWQRRTRGWDDSETWSLDHSLARWLAPRLEVLRDNTHGYPSRLDEDTWFAILDKTAQAFRFIERQFEDDWPMRKDAKKYVEEGLDLFREFCFDLWD